MSFLAIPAVPYIITGSMSLYLSYKTYSNYCQNVDYIELERDNKIKNQEEQEQKMENKNDDNINFVSVDEKQNVSIESLSPPSSPSPKSNSNLENRPPTPYPYEKKDKKLLELETQPIEYTTPEIPPETIEDSNQEQEYKLNSIEELPAREEILESPIPSEEECSHPELKPEAKEDPEPLIQKIKVTTPSQNKKKKRKRKKNKKK